MKYNERKQEQKKQNKTKTKNKTRERNTYRKDKFQRIYLNKFYAILVRPYLYYLSIFGLKN